MNPITSSPNFAVLGHTDQGGRPDGVQLMLHAGHAYIGHMFSDGITIVDVRDPRAPHAVGFIACPPNTRSHTICRCMTASCWPPIPPISGRCSAMAIRRIISPRRLPTASPGASVSSPPGCGSSAWPTQPRRREIGFCPVDGIGLHRIWWVGGRYAYASCHFDGFTDHILAVFDVARSHQAATGRPLGATGHGPRRWRGAALAEGQALGAAPHDRRRHHRLRRVARWRRHPARPDRPGRAPLAGPPRAVTPLRRGAPTRRCRCRGADCCCWPTKRPAIIARTAWRMPG